MTFLFLRNSVLQISPEMAIDILTASDQLVVPRSDLLQLFPDFFRLKEAMIQSLANTVDTNNVLSLLEIANVYDGICS